MIIERIDHYKNGTIITDAEAKRKIYYTNECPVCGLKRLRVMSLNYYAPPKYVISCYNCEARTHLCGTPEGAMAARIFK